MKQGNGNRVKTHNPELVRFEKARGKSIQSTYYCVVDVRTGEEFVLFDSEPSQQNRHDRLWGGRGIAWLRGHGTITTEQLQEASPWLTDEDWSFESRKVAVLNWASSQLETANEASNIVSDGVAWLCRKNTKRSQHPGNLLHELPSGGAA